MDASVLAQTMLEWEQRKRRLDELEVVIKAAIMELKETQKVGNVQARYSKGRKSYDYEVAVRNTQHVTHIVARHTKTVITTDWPAICKDAEIEDVPYTEDQPSVSLRLLEK